jgi:hypothetical protein
MVNNIFLKSGQVFRVVGHDEPLQGHFLVREKYEQPMLSQDGGWDTTFKSGWLGTAWHTVKDELPAWVNKTYNEFNYDGRYHHEIIEIINS